MTRQQRRADYLDQVLKPGSFVFRRGRIYQVELPEEAGSDPLTIWLRDAETSELMTFRVEELLLLEGPGDEAAPVFAPTLEKLKQVLQEPKLPSQATSAGTLPEKLLQRAGRVVETVEAVRRLVGEQERLARLRGDKMNQAAAIKQACTQLNERISQSTYYEYRKLYRQYGGDRASIAAALRRKTFNQTTMSKAGLHFIDTLVLRFYAGRRTLRLRPQALYKLATSTLQRTGNLWLDPSKSPGTGAGNVVEELLNPYLPMPTILENPEKAAWLTKIELPSRSWFYTYLRWFEAQPDQGKKVVDARYGEGMWEREYMVFDTFVNRAVRPLEYVFADHWLMDVFIVDAATRSRLDRLWLTLLLDAYSRSVLGMTLLYEVPCIESIQSALRHAIWPKLSHQALGIPGEWICYGIPQQLYLDNAWAHHSHSLERLAQAISQEGQYNSIDLVFRPPYRGRYGALIERLFGNFSGQLQELLSSAIASSQPGDVQNAAQRACLLYQDIYYIIHQLIVRYQHTPHGELNHMTPHQKWLEGWQLGYGGFPPPLTDEVERLFWRHSPETRIVHGKGVSVFGMHYWSPILDQAQRKELDGQPVRYHFSYEPADISRLAIFRDRHWLGDVYAKELRRADGSPRLASLWERKMAQAMACEKGQASRDWLAFVTELAELEQKRASEKRQARRKSSTKRSSRPDASQLEAAIEQVKVGQDYTDLLMGFAGDSSGG